MGYPIPDANPAALAQIRHAASMSRDTLLALNRLHAVPRELESPRGRKIPDKQPGEFASERLVVAYRYLRWALHVAGAIRPGQTTRQAMTEYMASTGVHEPSPEASWVFGVQCVSRPGGPSIPLPGYEQAHEIVNYLARDLPETPPELADHRPIHLTRQPIHPGPYVSAVETMPPNRGYHFIESLRIAIRALNMRQKCVSNGDYGLLGIDPDYDVDPDEPAEALFARCTLYWPTPSTLFEFESLVFAEISGNTSDYHSDKQIRELLHLQYGLCAFEQQDWLLTGRNHLLVMRPIELDVERAVYLTRLDHVAKLARDVGDHRAELGAIREQARISGVTRDAADSHMDEATEAVRLAALRREEEFAAYTDASPIPSTLLD